MDIHFYTSPSALYRDVDRSVEGEEIIAGHGQVFNKVKGRVFAIEAIRVTELCRHLGVLG